MTDVTPIVEETREAIELIAREFLEGTAEDIALYAERITFNLLAAQASGRPDLIANNLGQLAMLREATRLRAERAKWEAFQTIIQKVVQVGVKALLTAV